MYVEHEGDPVGGGRRAAAPRVRRRSGRRRADPGRPAGPGGGQVRRPGAADVLHPRRARAGHPAPGRRRTARRGSLPPTRRSVIDLGCGIGGDLVAFAEAGLTAAGRRPRPGAGGGRRGQPGRPRPGRRGGGRRRHRGGRLRLRRGVRRPGPPLRARVAPSTSTTGRRRGRSSRACSPAGRVREGRARHPPRPGPRRASRPSGSATTARSRRRRCGRRTSPRPGAGRPCSARTRPGHADRGGRPVRRASRGRCASSAPTSTSRTVR